MADDSEQLKISLIERWNMSGNMSEDYKKLQQNDKIKDATIKVYKSLGIIDADNNPVTPKNDDDSITEKQELKHKLKAKQKRKWKIGDTCILKVKPTSNKPIIKFEYKIVKVVYKINSSPMCSLVVYQTDGPECKKSTLNKTMCSHLHIKWRPGLEIISMDLPLTIKRQRKHVN